MRTPPWVASLQRAPRTQTFVLGWWWLVGGLRYQRTPTPAQRRRPTDPPSSSTFYDAQSPAGYLPSNPTKYGWCVALSAVKRPAKGSRKKGQQRQKKRTKCPLWRIPRPGNALNLFVFYRNSCAGNAGHLEAKMVAVKPTVGRDPYRLQPLAPALFLATKYISPPLPVRHFSPSLFALHDSRLVRRSLLS